MFNRVILIGRLTADPELRQTPNGISVATFSIACDRRFQSKEGERQTDFINIVAWRNHADFVAKYFGKGKLILIEGSIQTRRYTDKEGKNRTAFEVVADQVQFAETKAASTSAGIPAYGQPPFQTQNSPMQMQPPMQQSAPPISYSQGSVGDFVEVDDSDADDLPF